jgi:hypothetical protein
VLAVPGRALAGVGMGVPAASDDGSCVAPSSRLAGGALDLHVGYVESPPLAWNGWGRPTHPTGVAVDVLNLLARKNGWRLHFAPFAAGNVVASVAHCKIDVGIVPSEPGSSVWSEENPPDLTAPYLESVAAVALLGDASAPDGMQHAPVSVGMWMVVGLRAIVFGLLGVALLVGLVWVVNLRVPWTRGRLLPERFRVVALDSTVAGVRAGLPWLWSSRAGQVLMVVWFLGAAAGELWQMPVQAAPWSTKRTEYAEALEHSLDGTTAVGVRPGGRTVECHDLVRCLQDLTRGDLSAVAAGADEICHYVRERRLEHVQFASSMLWPNAHSFLVPPGSALRRTLNAALAAVQREDAPALTAIHEAYGLPWSAPTLTPSCPVVLEAKR